MSQPYRPPRPVTGIALLLIYMSKVFHWFLGLGEAVSLVRRSLFCLLYNPQVMDYDECEVVGIMGSKVNRNSRQKLASGPLCPPQIPHDLTWARSRATGVRRRRLTAWAKARPFFIDTKMQITWTQTLRGRKCIFVRSWHPFAGERCLYTWTHWECVCVCVWVVPLWLLGCGIWSKLLRHRTPEHCKQIEESTFDRYAAGGKNSKFLYSQLRKNLHNVCRVT
jgi:hypothetical protein